MGGYGDFGCVWLCEMGMSRLRRDVCGHFGGGWYRMALYPSNLTACLLISDYAMQICISTARLRFEMDRPTNAFVMREIDFGKGWRWRMKNCEDEDRSCFRLPRSLGESPSGYSIGKTNGPFAQ